MPNVIDDEELYNVIVLGGVTSPGKVTLSGHDRKVTWDVKSGPSLKGATTTLKSIDPIEFTASFYLVKDDSQGVDDFADWEVFVQIINGTVQGKIPKALDIYHPDLAANDIKSVVKAQVGGMTYDGKGGGNIAVKFQEYLPKKKQGGTPSGSGKPGPPPPDPNQDAKDALAQALQAYQDTPWG